MQATKTKNLAKWSARIKVDKVKNTYPLFSSLYSIDANVLGLLILVKTSSRLMPSCLYMVIYS